MPEHTARSVGGFIINTFLCQYFWGHICPRTGKGVESRNPTDHMRFVFNLCLSEISNFESRVHRGCGEQDVRRLQVAVYDRGLSRMEIHQSTGDLLCKIARGFSTQSAGIRVNKLPEITATAILEHQEYLFWAGVKVV